MIQASRVPLAKKSLRRSSISARVLPGERISTAKSGAPGKNRFSFGLKPSAVNRLLGTKETSGARQLRLNIQKPVLESKTAPKRCSNTKLPIAIRSREQMRPWYQLFFGLITNSPLDRKSVV